MQIVVIIGMVWLPESPDFYFAKGRFDESREVVLRIAKFNGKTVTRDMISFGGNESVHSEVAKDGNFEPSL